MNDKAKHIDLALWAIMLLATALRIYSIGSESLWIDEGQTVAYATKSFGEIIEYCARDVHPPLYLFIMHIWTELFGISEISLRLPSAIFGVIAVFLTYRVGEKIMNRNAALLGALFLAVSYMGINFSQEARSYTMLLSAILLSCHGLLLFIDNPNRKNFLYYAASIALMLYIHTFTVFIIMFHQLYFITGFILTPGQRIKRLGNWISVNIAALIIFSPWLFFLVKQVLAKLGGEGPGSWVPAPDFFTAWRTLIQLAGGSAPLAAAAIALFLCLISAAIPSLRRMITPSRQDQTRNSMTGLFLGLWLLCAVVTPFVFSLILSPIYVERYAIQFLPGFCLFVGLVITRIAPPALKVAALSLFLIATAHGLWLYYTSYDKEQWREVAQFVNENIKPGDALVLSAPWIYEPFVYYFGDDGDPKIIPAFSHVNLKEETKNFDNIWLIQAHEFFSDPEGDVPALLSESRLVKKHKDFKEGINTNPILVHFQSIRVTKYDAGRMQDYLRKGNIGGKQNTSSEHKNELVAGLPDSLIIEQSGFKVTNKNNSTVIESGPDTRLRYRFESPGKVGEGAISFRILPQWKNDSKKHMLLMAKGSKWDKGSVFLEMSPEKTLRALFFKDGFTGMVEGQPIQLSNNQWHNISLDWNRTSTSIFVDGNLYAKADLPLPFQSDFKTLHLGADHQNQFPALGEYDDLMIFDTPLSVEDAQNLYTSGSARPAYWYDLDLQGRRNSTGIGKGFSSGQDQFFTSVTPKSTNNKNMEGSASFTFTPDWSAGDEKQRMLLGFYGKAWNMGSMFLEKTPKDFLQLIRWEKGSPSCVVGQKISDWKQNEPHKISISWNSKETSLTLDGKTFNSACSPNSESGFESLTIANDGSGNLPAMGKFEDLRINP
ncbi:Concanavalin A-like lectin/glucanases superfamily protein [Maridesulfovibrio ferrireducens]|uniref:Concanavalin A-like lectin/glucanases superfamily protein n=1 Tax=Maridesulfovibrio ferrireducens TaxID=246191 RepID=A0A1G9EWU2_9BACT|nr:glycosyltransferase family 39 protein [Maridesulfovibrio ferrireducens]SDK80614.1 Concanavalin A-like lectin/glucanases superfamily protein [Maridesulfovibrio ferrireducens]